VRLRRGGDRRQSGEGVNEPDDFVRLLEGHECRGMVAQEFWHHGAPSDLVNIVFLQVSGGTWLRFYFDAGVFFWRSGAPEQVTGGEPAFEYRLTDLGARFGVSGQRISRVHFTQPDPDCARLVIAMERGRLILDNADDHSRIAFVGAK
jgi:hypothetical protein